MSTLLRIEEVVLFLFGIYLFTLTSYDWWVFPLLLLTPDLSMIGYLINTKVGAFGYNLIHNRIVAVVLIIAGMSLSSMPLMLIGVILFSHIAMDRVMGYGLKHTDAFKHTHLDTLYKQ